MFFKKTIKNVSRIDIGCGREKEQGYFGIDAETLPGVDHAVDLNSNPLPFKDNSIDHIVTYHALEHFANLSHVINEMWRVSKPNGQIFVCVPYYSNHLNLTNPFHLHQFNEHSFRFFSSEEHCNALPERIWKQRFANTWGLKGSANTNPDVELRTLKIEIDYFPEYKALSEVEKEKARQKYYNVAHNICFYLQVIKGDKNETTPQDLIVPEKRKWMLANNW